MTRPAGTTPAVVRVVEGDEARTRHDVLATEEPLEIRVSAASSGTRDVKTVAITMRTPGADFELAAGFLFSEGVLAGRDDLHRIDYCLDGSGHQQFNVVTVHLAAGQLPPLETLARHGTVSSACGVCGKATLEDLRGRGVPPLSAEQGPVLEPDVLYSLPDALRAGQGTFSATGGLHAAGLFTADGTRVVVREDIGRHNAVDKAIGWALLKDRLGRLSDCILVVSGRAGFEIVQKAAVAAVPIVCAVSAPSSLAVAVARDFGITLVGFLRGRRANVYAGEHRLRSR